MLKVATVFSGIGAIEHALKRSNIDHKVIFACDNGDVDILSKEIDNDINEMYLEVKLLDSKINNIKESQVNDSGIKSELMVDLNKVKQILHVKVSELRAFDTEIIDNCESALFILLQNKTMKKVRIKEFSDFMKKLVSNNNYKIFDAMKCSIKLISEYSKDNSLENLEISNPIFASKDNVIWDSIYPQIISIYKSLENNNFRKIVKEFKLVSETLSMLHERINTLEISNNIKALSTHKEKKSYIDSLYESKKNHNKVRQSYMANYEIDDADFHWNVSFLDGTQYKDNVDLFVGGSPCQAFSLVGKQRGLEDTRGTLFYEFARLVKEIQPKVFIYENVKAVLSNDNGRTWETMKAVFDELGYEWKDSILNARDFGIPQNRERVFVVGFRKDLKLSKPYTPPSPIKLEKVMQDSLLDNVSGKYYLPTKGVKFVTDQKNLSKRYTQIDGDIQLCQKKNQQFNWHGDFVFVEENNNMEKTMEELEKYFLSEKVEKYVMSTGTKGFYSKPKTDLKIARPLLTTMHKMHRAGVDNYVTTQGRLRKLTPRECLRLMGFCDSFKVEVSDTSMYQQAGNSIVVDVLIAITNKILEAYPKIIMED